MDLTRGSRTAVLVCQGRAVADGRVAVGLFADPVACRLLRAGEQAQVERARRADPPADAGTRLVTEWLRATADVVVPRTVAIDQAVRARPCPQLVILGAGLDTRAWRMAELVPAEVFEVDHPVSQADKRARAGPLRPLPRTLRLVPVDFSADELGPALDAAGHVASTATTWLWEGVVPYLTRAEVRRTLAAVTARSAPGSRLIVHYSVPAVSQTAGALLARALFRLTRQEDPLAAEPRRSAWTAAAMARLLRASGFARTSDENLLDACRRLGLPASRPRSLRAGRIAVADR